MSGAPRTRTQDADSEPLFELPAPGPELSRHLSVAASMVELEPGVMRVVGLAQNSLGGRACFSEVVLSRVRHAGERPT
jgi:hypothetical protein